MENSSQPGTDAGARATGDPLSLEEFRTIMSRLAGEGAPGQRSLAGWLSEYPEELAFRSVRGLAEAAGSNPNTVVRVMKAAGFPSFAVARRVVQQALRQPQQGYAARAGALRDQPSDHLLAELSDAAHANASKAFSPHNADALQALVPHLLAARRVHCIGVRMGFALSHYFSYRGALAHANVMPTPSQPGLIADALAECSPEDVVIVISFSHYSAEVVRAAQIARAQGARVVAITDQPDSPLCTGAWKVLRAPVSGPNLMYSMAGALLQIEALLELMAARDQQAKDRVATFETRLLELGAYVRGTARR